MQTIQKPVYRLVIDRDPDPQDPRNTRYRENFGHMICFHKRYTLGDEHSYASHGEFIAALLEKALDNRAGNFGLMKFITNGNSKHAHLSYDADNDIFHLSEIIHADGEQKLRKVASCCGDIVQNDQDFALAMFETMSLSEIMDFLRKRYAPVLMPLYLYDHSGISISTRPFADCWDSGMVGYIYCTQDDITQEFGECSDETIARAKAALESEVKTYDAYLNGDVYMYTLYLGDEEIDGCCGFIGDLSEILSDIGSFLPADATTFTVDLSNAVGCTYEMCS